MMRIVVCGGGTAGHVSPALATCDALKSLDKSVKLLYIGQRTGMEARIVASVGLKFAPIRAGKFRRNHFAHGWAKVLDVRTLGPNVVDVFKTLLGIVDCWLVLRKFKPDVVFIKGGFVGVPVGIAARLLKIPYVVHESDVTPGLANRIVGRWATKIGVGFPVKHYVDFDKRKLVFVGNPVREGIMKAHRLEGLAKFRLDEKLPVVLVTGGSQGARQINDVVLEALPQLVKRYQVIHQTGEGESERVKFELRHQDVPHLERYHPFAFLVREMGVALAAADVVVGRAGVGTIAESAVLGKPTILIPNYQMAGHQTENARILSRAGAARVLDGRTLTGVGLMREIDRVMRDETEQKRLSQAIARFARPTAAYDMARLILAVGRGKGYTEQDPNALQRGGVA